MKIIPETRRVHTIWYLRFYPLDTQEKWKLVLKIELKKFFFPILCLGFEAVYIA